MNVENERRACAFIRSVSGRCKQCLVRSDENCRDCLATWANSILHDIEAESSNAANIDYSLSTRIRRIIDILGKSDKPLLSSQIDMSKYCTRQLKRWTLVYMLNHGMINRCIMKQNGTNIFYGYSLKDIH